METQKHAPHDAAGGGLDAVKGGKQSNGKGKGCGQCWHRGQMGHPRREYLELLKLQSGIGIEAALKEGEWQSNRANGKTGKRKNGVKGNGWMNNWRSPGKAVGNSLNYWGSDDFCNAWGWGGHP